MALDADEQLADAAVDRSAELPAHLSTICFCGVFNTGPGVREPLVVAPAADEAENEGVDGTAGTTGTTDAA